MRNTIIRITAAACLAVAQLAAGPWDKLTKLDVKETILIPGRQLPPGKYVMKLMDSPSDRHIVMIYNEDQSKLEAILLAIPNSRLQPTGDTVLKYWETPAGVPPALRAWFYPGDSFGQEFAYPKEMAAELSRVNNAKVIHYEGPNVAEVTADSLKSAQVYDAPTVEVAAAPAAAPAPANVAPAATPEPAPTPQPVAEPAPSPAPQPVLMAQNRTPEPTPAPAEPELPQTASDVPALALLGATFLFAAGALRLRQARS